MNECEICRGTGVIRLPVYPSVRAFSPENVPAISEPFRQFPCPLCSDIAPFERLQIVESRSKFDSRGEADPRYMEMVMSRSAHALIDGAYERGYIQFERQPTDPREMSFRTRSMLCVVSQKHVATMEQRIAERQMDVAQEVVAKAQSLIMNWASQYTGSEGSISKDQATREVREALDWVVTRRMAPP